MMSCGAILESRRAAGVPAQPSGAPHHRCAPRQPKECGTSRQVAVWQVVIRAPEGVDIMAGTPDKDQEPGRGREKQDRLGPPGQDPVHSRHPSSEPGVEASSPRLEDDRRRDAEDLRDEHL